ncbi:SusD/RagB family nutrient-binding outer membrane lipoprotein [Reichenbachiella sp.]|uniref:SusD/RagB family nutrient-binding outer membrane lipoprotein n=1 Tax=Reichenbachiella sp. TaxID=2184521 RepID=UPI003BB1A4C5
MKIINIKYWLLFAVISWSCTDDFDEINTDPNAYNEIDPSFQLAKVQLDLSGKREEAWRYDLGITSSMIQHFSGSWWCQHGAQYRVVEQSHWYSLWEESYPRDAKNVQSIIDATVDDPEQVNINSAARIMKVLIYSKITDLYGDIPYSQAVKGFTEGILTPVYDSQEDIYTDFFKELDEAVAAFDDSKETMSSDLFFAGDLEKWRRFGNSLRLRLGFRLTKIDIAEAETQVTAAIAGGLMQSNDDNAIMLHSDFSYSSTENRGNGRSQVFNASANSEGFRLTNTLVDFLKNTGDPRLSIYGGTYTAPKGDPTRLDVTPHLQEGIVHGALWWNLWSDYGDLYDEDANYVAYVAHVNKYMQPSDYITANDAPYFHLTYAEVEMFLTEAAARGWTADAATHWENGVRAGMQHVGMYPGAPAITETQITDFLAANPLPAATEDQIRVANEQLWLIYFMNGTEAYANYRRSGYPELVPFTNVEWYYSGTDGVMPRRFFYPEFEAQNNPTNYEDAISRIGGTNNIMTPVWWDKQ